MADRFYVNSPLGPGPVSLAGPEAAHLAVVCRFRPGDAVCLFNGDGHEYPARVVSAARRAVELLVTEVRSPERELPWRLEVAAPLPKGDRGPFLVEKLTELGAAVFVPLRTRRSVVHPGEARLDRLQRHVVESAKQCGRNRLLEVGPLTEWDSYCASPALPALRVLAHPGQPPLPVASRSDRVLAVGPEGGFTEEEVERGTTNGWTAVGLGPRILRVETAALALVAWSVYGGPS